MAIKIDVNRGCVIRKEPKSGKNIYMYKSEPGVFYTADGREASIMDAQLAGFDTETLLFQKYQREEEAKALAEVTERLAKERAAIRTKAQSKAADAVASATAPQPPPEKEKIGAVIDLGGAYKIKHVSGGRYQVVDHTGADMLDKLVSKAEAEAIAKQLSQG